VEGGRVATRRGRRSCEGGSVRQLRRTATGHGLIRTAGETRGGGPFRYLVPIGMDAPQPDGPACVGPGLFEHVSFEDYLYPPTASTSCQSKGILAHITRGPSLHTHGGDSHDPLPLTWTKAPLIELTSSRAKSRKGTRPGGFQQKRKKTTRDRAGKALEGLPPCGVV
jgi:hypothetical protein